jgi:hypothetical protein
MVTRDELQTMFQKSMKSVGMSTRLDRVREVGIGGYQITFTVKPADAPRIDPFKVGTVFAIKNRSYEVTGKNLRKWKFPVQVKRLPDGKRFCVTSTSVQDGFLYVRGEGQK